MICLLIMFKNDDDINFLFKFHLIIHHIYENINLHKHVQFNYNNYMITACI